MITDVYQHYAKILDDAVVHGRAIPQISAELMGLEGTVDDAYTIQKLAFDHRLERGETQAGFKMGLTSHAKMKQVGVDEVIWGRLSNTMLIEEGGNFSLSRSIHPRIEPEIAFILGKDLSGLVTPAQAMNCVEAIAPAMEIIDSRYENFKFNLFDVVADNASSSGYILGNWCSKTIDIENLGMEMTINGQVVGVGSSAAILGHPVRSLVAAAKAAEYAQQPLKAGWVVLAGSATEAIPISMGDHIRTRVQNLGNVSMNAAS